MKKEKEKIRKQLNNEEMISFCSQMAMILHSGISPFEGVSLMEEGQEDGEGRKILQEIYDEMALGTGLCSAMEKTGVFPDYACQMVRLGETSGRPDEVMNSLAEYYTRENEIASTVRRAVSYPLFMLVMMLGVLFVLMVKVMPVFQQVFQSLGMQMDGPAGTVLHMGQVLSRYSWVFALLLVLLLAVLLWFSKAERGRRMAADLLRKSKATRRFVRCTAQYRLAFGMEMCLKSGLDPQQSLELMEQLVEDPEIRKKIGSCREELMQGAFFEEAVIHAELFDSLHNRMIRIGQRTGSIDQVMGEIAVQCETQASDWLWNKVGMIEPTVVIVLAVLVGVILLSVMLPLMGIMSQIG